MLYRHTCIVFRKGEGNMTQENNRVVRHQKPVLEYTVRSLTRRQYGGGGRSSPAIVRAGRRQRFSRLIIRVKSPNSSPRPREECQLQSPRTKATLHLPQAAER